MVIKRRSRYARGIIEALPIIRNITRYRSRDHGCRRFVTRMARATRWISERFKIAMAATMNCWRWPTQCLQQLRRCLYDSLARIIADPPPPGRCFSSFGQRPGIFLCDQSAHIRAVTRWSSRRMRVAKGIHTLYDETRSAPARRATIANGASCGIGTLQNIRSARYRQQAVRELRKSLTISCRLRRAARGWIRTICNPVVENVTAGKLQISTRSILKQKLNVVLML